MCRCSACTQFLLVFLLNAAIFVTVAMVYKCAGLSFAASAGLLGGYFALQTLLAMAFTCCDKDQAVHGGWRVAKIALFTWCFFCGALGMIIGLLTRWHKVRKCHFVAMVLILVPVNAAWIMLGFALGAPYKTVCGAFVRWNSTGVNATVEYIS